MQSKDFRYSFFDIIADLEMELSLLILIIHPASLYFELTAMLLPYAAFRPGRWTLIDYYRVETVSALILTTYEIYVQLTLYNPTGHETMYLIKSSLHNFLKVF